MTQCSAVTVIAARFDAPLSKGDDNSAHPDGARLSTAGTEIGWDTPDGMARRERHVRSWLSIWPDLDAALAFHRDHRNHLPILARATESVAMVGLPYACHGTLNWLPSGAAADLYPQLSKRPEKAGLVLVMTSLGIGNPQEGLVAFGQGVTAVRKAFAENPAVLMDVNMLPDMPMIDGPTLTLWRSEKDVMAGAYRSDPHKTAMKMRNGALSRASFTRMAVVAAEGTWGGHDVGRA